MFNKIHYFKQLFLTYEQTQQLNEADRIPKEKIDILKDQVFGFDTFFVTGQEPYEVGNQVIITAASTALSLLHLSVDF